jgi:hypothetical protein
MRRHTFLHGRKALTQWQIRMLHNIANRYGVEFCWHRGGGNGRCLCGWSCPPYNCEVKTYWVRDKKGCTSGKRLRRALQKDMQLILHRFD